MSDSFQPIKDSFTPDSVQTPDASFHPADMLMNLYHQATTKNLDNAPSYDLLAQGARLGQVANKGNQQLADMSAEILGRAGVNPYLAAIPGTVLGTASEFLLPQNRLGVGLTALVPLAKALKGPQGASSSIPEPPVSGDQAAFRGVGSTLIPRSSDPLVKKWAQAMGEYQEASIAASNSRSAAFQSGNIDAFEKEFADGTHPAAKQMEAAFNKIQALQKANPELSDLNSLENDQIKNLASEGPEAKISSQGEKPNPPGALAQFITARAGRANGKLTPQMAQYAIDNPKVLDDAPSLGEATANYKEAIGDLKGKTQDLAGRLNKTVIRPGDYDNAIDRAGRILKGTPAEGEPDKLNSQEALTGLQSINQALRDKAYTQAMSAAQKSEILKVKDGLLDFLQSNGSPKIRSAGKQLYEANIKDAFSSWFPQNKFGSPDALRTTIGMGQLSAGMGEAAASMALGHPGGALIGAGMIGNAALASPRVSGQLIRELGAIKDPATWELLRKSGVPASNALGDNQ